MLVTIALQLRSSFINHGIQNFCVLMTKTKMNDNMTRPRGLARGLYITDPLYPRPIDTPFSTRKASNFSGTIVSFKFNCEAVTRDIQCHNPMPTRRENYVDPVVITKVRRIVIQPCVQPKYLEAHSCGVELYENKICFGASQSLRRLLETHRRLCSHRCRCLHRWLPMRL